MPTRKSNPKAAQPVEPAAPVEPVLPVVPETPIQPALPPAPQAVQPLSPSDERTWAVLAHLSGLLCMLLFAIGGPVAALIIYLVYKDRSRYVAYHSLQAMLFQLIGWFGGGVLIGALWLVVGIVSVITLGLAAIILVPLAVILTLCLSALPLAAVIYGIVGAIQVSQGKDFKYWLVGDWVRSTLTGS
jgi:uncharacterized protein